MDQVMQNKWIPNSTQSYNMDRAVEIYLREENDRGYIQSEEQFQGIAENATRALLAEPFRDRDVVWFKGVSYEELYPIVLERTKAAFQYEVDKERAWLKANTDEPSKSMRVLFGAILATKD